MYFTVEQWRVQCGLGKPTALFRLTYRKDWIQERELWRYLLVTSEILRTR